MGECPITERALYPVLVLMPWGREGPQMAMAHEEDRDKCNVPIAPRAELLLFQSALLSYPRENIAKGDSLCRHAPPTLPLLT